jgi:hypothetical protein
MRQTVSRSAAEAGRDLDVIFLQQAQSQAMGIHPLRYTGCGQRRQTIFQGDKGRCAEFLEALP